jgi:hypothetical protein
MKWCKHIKMTVLGYWKIHDWDFVQASWKFCPICGAKRPKKIAMKKAGL